MSMVSKYSISASEKYASDDFKPGDLKIDREFQNLVPAISDEERKQLEENIVDYGGARDPLTAWLRGDYDFVLVDGHNRYEICTRLGLPFTVHSVEFDSRDEAADWIDRNQLGRRNLSKQDYILLVGRRYNRAKRNDSGHGDQKSGGQNARPKEKASERLAREHRVNEKTVRRAGKFQAAAAKLGIEQEIAAGEVKASVSEIVQAAESLPDKPTADDIKQASERVKASASKRAKGKQADKPSASDTRRKNAQLAKRITKALISLRGAVEMLAETDSAYREQALAELQGCVGHVSRAQATAKPEVASDDVPQVDDERAAMKALVAKQWDRVKKQFAVAELPLVRRLILEIVKDERKEMKD